ncbi:MAG: N-acetyltransferase family protein, partial [Candidatus Hodarchaeales archaeon]
MSSDIPDYWIKNVTLTDGTKVLLRPEKKSDLTMLKSMFQSLSDNSKRLLTAEIAEERIEGWITNLDYEIALPIVSVVQDPNGQERIISAASLEFYKSTSYKHKTVFGITVHDDYQNQGLGTIVTQHMIEIARRMGLKKMYLRVQTDNERAIHVYKKCGFHIEGRLEMEYWNFITGEYG